MKFEFAKYTEVTDFALRINPEYNDRGCTRVFVCADVNSFWLARLIEGFNEDYEAQEGSYILERDKIDMNTKGENLTVSRLRKIIEADCGDNYDMEVGEDPEELINMLDDGFGIIDRKEF